MTTRARQMDEQEMRRGEDRIPELAAKAGRAAHEKSLSVMGKVVIVRGADLIEKHADGHVVVLRRIGEPVKARPGVVFRRKR